MNFSVNLTELSGKDPKESFDWGDGKTKIDKPGPPDWSKMPGGENPGPCRNTPCDIEDIYSQDETNPTESLD